MYQQLRALDRLGICRRLPWDHATGRLFVDPKNVYWTYCHDDTLAEVIADIERADSSS